MGEENKEFDLIIIRLIFLFIRQ
ncbi:uncharacterized protein METZ01_LOCUS118432 [marine metagenome]|uniref:Uncharacterized protein n=1 Tax=marine metagenome TaxID=408172 RepID=A0A381XLG4_9ZZZZ